MAQDAGQAMARRHDERPLALRPAFRWIPAVRFAVGPIALAGFFLPWAHGPGPLGAESFSGFELVGYTGHLQQLDLGAGAAGTLWAIRFAVLGIAVAGAWQLVLAPGHRWHPGYAASGWYLAAGGVVLISIGLLRTGLALPPPGSALIVLAALIWCGLRLGGQRAAKQQR